MTESSSDPFWLHQPWRVLTDILDLQRISPWEINLAELVTGFIGRLLAADIIDFRICGRALLSAAILLRLKSEYLLEFGREEEEVLRIIEEEIFLPPIRPPFRQYVRPTSTSELIEALRELIFPPVKRMRKRQQIPLPSFAVTQLDVTHVELIKSMKQIYAQLLLESHEKDSISFFDFVQGMTHLEIVRVFLSLLYLMSDKKVSIAQEHEFGDILIWVSNEIGEVEIQGA